MINFYGKDPLPVESKALDHPTEIGANDYITVMCFYANFDENRSSRNLWGM